MHSLILSGEPLNDRWNYGPLMMNTEEVIHQ